ncbi:hypothetical protein [Alicyclobacillus ferrooxydans]|uniref:Uncharacterized protein n=1 Tax=Alicyclobacillus ferrooxydans TaxID=471514 RepID=A0A0P9CI05_9BACL|nr:hypothetical protein [Alicyclobacillus ferrooxydans]KPV42670.1 hypothetical protein AN477_16185 [Alicyclobacillus ferrooxydans]
MDVQKWKQLDLFDIAEANDWKNKVYGSTFALDDIRIGDRFEVHWSNGVQFTGTFVTRGWWQTEREELDYYWLQTEKHDFRHMSSDDEWVYLGHDDSYTPPRKDDICERLVDVLKQVPLDKRIPALQSFEHQYPYLSSEYHPLVREAWDKAIVAVTSLDELLSYYASWTCKAEFPKGKGSVIREYVQTVFQFSREQWKEELLKLRWTEGGQQGCFVYRFAARDVTYYRPLYLHYITECRTPEELLKLMVMRGSDSSYERSMKSDVRVWVDEGDPEKTQQAC